MYNTYKINVPASGGFLNSVYVNYVHVYRSHLLSLPHVHFHVSHVFVTVLLWICAVLCCSVHMYNLNVSVSHFTISESRISVCGSILQ